MKTFWYFPLELLKARYTPQLSYNWIPNAFKDVNTGEEFRFESLSGPDVHNDITMGGKVLDPINRGLVSLAQMSSLLQRFEEVTNDDVIYLQDFWTPGLEAVLYALSLTGKAPRIYATCYAQSVDEYDFTYPMRAWMRPIELGWASVLSGMFVASTIHRDQLRAAGITCPIHVIGLQIDLNEIHDRMPPATVDVTSLTRTGHSYYPGGTREKRVVYSSRLNNEKNPHFMLEVAARFLENHLDWSWVVTTSARELTSEVPGVLQTMQHLRAVTSGRFTWMEDLTKDDYYRVLRTSRVQFNCALQDYVSFTMLEASIAGCDLCYPDFRSFPEVIHPSRRYAPFSVQDAMTVLADCVHDHTVWTGPSQLCDRGRVISLAIMLRDWQGPEVNIWHQPLSYFIHAGLL